MLGTVSLNRAFGDFVSREPTEPKRELKRELQAIDAQVADATLEGWVNKMTALVGNRDEAMSEIMGKARSYPLLTAISLAIREQAATMNYDDQRTQDMVTGARLALSALTEIAEEQSLPPIE